MQWMFLIFFLLPFALPQAALAHAFGQQYTLPVPFWLYLYGSAAALLVSFLVIGYFLHAPNKRKLYSSLDLSGFWIFRFVQGRSFVNFIQICSVFFLALALVTGVFGVDDATVNFSMTYFWIILVLGTTYLSAIFGDIWSITNPWSILCDWEESIRRRPINGIFRYPKKLAYYPALLVYYIFIWIELVGKTTPHALGYILLGYTLFNNIGVALIGKRDWFTYCEFFSVFFRLLSKLSPLAYKDRMFSLRMPFVGLLNEEASHMSLLLFILFMLASTAFDGFHATSTYRIFALPTTLFDSVFLLLSSFFFLLFYLLLLLVMKLIVHQQVSLAVLSLRFAYSLVPIALAYNVAHYYTLLLIQGQGILALLSDPFGLGWNLFGTSTFVPNIAIISTNFIWHSQVAVILIGHIAGVYLAHIMTLRIFPSRKMAIFSQLPMLALMVLYTVTGLWILSQPMIGG